MILRDKSALRRQTQSWTQSGARIGVVPTMGALHEGHLSLVRAAKSACDRVIVTIFVNPTQFNNPKDLEKYPRSEADDIQALAPFSVDMVYAPDAGQIYPDGFATKVSVSGLTAPLCGADRPGHFDGVATIVTKLLLQTGADQAFFGEKDFQQLQVVRRLVADLDLATEIVGCPTVRETDGLAMSSRNQRLTLADRRIAPLMHQEMTDIARALANGAQAGPLCMAARVRLLGAGFEFVDYLELRATRDLSLLDRADRPCRLFAAAHLGAVRLIDNLAVTDDG